jgi:hypothetical protein
MTRPVWTDEAVAAAKKYNDEGWSRSIIAGKIHEETGQRFSRNAVIGKLKRLGQISPRSSSAKNKNTTRVVRPRRKAIEPARIVSPALGTGFYSTADTPEKVAALYRRKAVEHDGQPVPMNIPFNERKEGECAFICSDGGEPATVCGHKQMAIFRFPAGEPSSEKSSYCPFHHGLTHQGYGSYAARQSEGFYA